MSIGLALAGWVVGFAGLAVAAAQRHAAARRRERLARVAHEVRRPLAAAVLAADLAAREPGRIGLVGAELRRVAVALDDLDAIRGAASPARRREAVPLAPFLRELEMAWGPAAARTGRRLVVRGTAVPVEVRGDPVRLHRACSNLLANAFEHGRGRVEVAAVSRGRRVRLEVRDEGPGLAAPLLAITRRARAGRGRRGRGLAIAAGIAAEHGGRLVALPAPRGARLAIDLPARSAARATAAVPRAARRGAPGPAAAR